MFGQVWPPPSHLCMTASLASAWMPLRPSPSLDTSASPFSSSLACSDDGRKGDFSTCPITPHHSGQRGIISIHLSKMSTAGRRALSRPCQTVMTPLITWT